jgi:hypothetical protein
VRGRSSPAQAQKSSSHPAPAELLAQVSGRLTGETESSVTKHISSCPTCRVRARALRTLLRARDAAGLEPLPRGLWQRSVRLFEAWRQTRKAAPSGRRLAELARGALGRLTVRFGWPTRGGSLLAPAAALRSASLPPRCELTGGGYRVEMEWTRSGRISTVRGRVVPEGAWTEGTWTEGAPILLLEFPDHSLRRMSLGPRGFFGPARAPSLRFRALLATAQKAYRSGWVELS